MEEKTLVLLNDSFEVVSYDGNDKDQDVHYGINNIFAINSSPHCSKQGTNFDLVLKCKEASGVTITHFMIRGGENCTDPIKNGLVWFSNDDKEPKVEDYTKQFNDFTQEKFDGLASDDTHKPFLYFETSESTLEYETLITPPQSPKYIHIKFISSWSDGNIDVGYIGLVGVMKSDSLDEKTISKKIPSELNLTRKSVSSCNSLHSDLMPYFRKATSLIMFSGNEEAKKIFYDYSSKHYKEDENKEDENKDKIYYFFSSYPTTTRLERSVLDYIKGEYEGDYLLMLTSSSGKKYLFPSFKIEDLTSSAVDTFISSFQSGKATPYFRSAKRPENDSDPAHPGLTIVVSSSFNEIVLNKDKDVFLDVYADWCGPCRIVSPIVCRVAEALQKVDEVIIAKFDSENNDKDPDYLPERTIPTLKLFLCGEENKTHEKAIPFEGKRTASDMIKFIHENMKGNKFDLESVLKPILYEETIHSKIQDGKAVVYKLVETFEEIAEEHEDFNESNKELIAEIEGIKEKFNEEIDEIIKEFKDSNYKQNDENEAKLSKIVESFVKNEKITKFLEVYANHKNELEKKSLKNVIKLHSDDEFKTKMDDEKNNNKDKLVVIDFFAVWCGPCKFISPFYADLSEEFKEVCFLKIDVDECTETAQSCGINAMPTFQFYKNGEKIDELVGGNQEKLRAAIEKHK